MNTFKDQREAKIDSILNASPFPNRVLLEWATGTGKSKASIDILNSICNRFTPDSFEEIDVLLLVAESAHKKNWEKEFKKFPPNTSHIRIECYASLSKLSKENFYYDVIILDEAHHIVSDIRLEALKNIRHSYQILLSATIPQNTLDSLTNLFGKYYISKYSLQEAIDNNILPSPKIYFIPMELNNNYSKPTEEIIENFSKNPNKDIYVSYADRWKYLKNKKQYTNIRLHITCTEREKYTYLNSKIDFFKTKFLRTRNDIFKNKWLQLCTIRKRYLGELKTNRLKPLLSYLNSNSKRYICFCSSIEQSNVLSPSTSINSKVSNSLSIIDSFNNKEINSLYAVGMLQEGQNLVDIEAGVIIQLGNQEREFIQKFGRTLRADSPIQYILYFKETRDEEFANNVKELLGNIPFHITNLQHIIKKNK